MFTLEKIAEANSKVKSGADFPRLVQEMIEMGIVANDVFVRDGHRIFRKRRRKTRF